MQHREEFFFVPRLKGFKHSPETIRKIALSHKGRKFTEEHKRNISSAKKGNRHTEETKQKISESRKGMKLSEEARKKLSERNKGKKLSEETKQKMSLSKIGLKQSDEWIVKRVEKIKGRKHSKETRLKMRISAKNRDSSYLLGKNNPNWNGGSSSFPYCPKFNFRLKEKIRNRDERKCQLCSKPEIINGKRLDVHHIDGNKMQGCEGNQWHLVALCVSCNAKKDTFEKEFLLVSNSKT